MEIVTGSTGQVHVTPIDDAVRNGNVGYVNDKVVFTYYENLAAQAITANQVRVFSGYGMNQGRLFKIPKDTYDNVTIENGTSGYKRVDLIIARYEMDSQTGFESIDLVVKKGQNSNSYEDPTVDYSGDINAGDEKDDFPLYRVKLNGLVIEGVERLFELVPDGGRVGLIEEALEAGFKVDLASEETGHIGSAETIDIGVKNVLPIGHGGTGQNSAQGALNALANGATANTTTPADADVVLTKASGTWYQKSFLKVWEYIKGKLMGNTNYVAVSNGGTGRGTIGANKVLVGTGDTAIGTKDLVTSIENSDHDKIPTAKAVTDAMSAAGYGDMLSNDYTVTVNNTKVIALAKGGTGSTDGTINGVKLGKSGSIYGYWDGSTFKSFRQPTGNAGAAQVLSGYTFANASSDAVSGTMVNYSGANRQTVAPGGGTGNQTIGLGAGYHDSVIVNRTAPYDAGVAAQKAVSWTEQFDLYCNEVNGRGQALFGVVNASSWKITSIDAGVSQVKVAYQNSSKTQIGSLFEPTVNTAYTPPANAFYIIVIVYTNSAVASDKGVHGTFTKYANKLH